MSLYHKKANGKLLLSGEYFVLNGAKALVLPVRFGQTLTVQSTPQPGIHWTSIDCKGNDYFKASLQLGSTASSSIEDRLIQILRLCKQENPQAFLSGLECIIQADFELNWGLGSSSTLIYLLADFFKMNPYVLLEKTFGGSGYDVAAASKQSTFIYARSEPYNPMVQDVSLHPCWEQHVCFVYLGNKQDSREGIQLFKSKYKDEVQWNEKVGALTDTLVDAKSYEQLNEAFIKHENFIATQLEMGPIQEKLFRDYPGAVKSLGAWGGDFIAVTYPNSKEEVMQYFLSKGYSTMFFYQDIIIKG